MADDVNDPAAVVKARDELAALLRRAFNKVARSPYAFEAAQKYLCGAPPKDIVAYLKERGVVVSLHSAGAYRKMLDKLSETSRIAIVASASIKEKDDILDFSTVQVLKKTITSIERRITAIEKEAQAAGGLETKREAQLMDYYKTLVDLRKQLEKERLESEVIQTAKRTIKDVAGFAVPFLDDRGKRGLVEKIRQYEQENY